MSTTRFLLGQTVATRAALATLSPADVFVGLTRHARGDWGDVCAEDALRNDEALVAGDRLVSVYHGNDGTKFYIITEWDRSVTTVLLPSDY